MRSATLMLALVASLTAAVVAADDTGVPVVVAVDTSRSLSANDLALIRQRVGETLQQLPAATPVGLVTFNNEAQWRHPVGASADAVVDDLPSLRPAGEFTVLHDALFLAARELRDGGVVLAITDGRDESSATTIDDVARLCETHGVRIVTASVGRRVDERSLRRLALLSQGRHLGRLATTGTPAVVSAIGSLASSIAEEQIVESAPQLTPPVTEAGHPAAAAPEASGGELWLPSGWVAAAAVLALGLGVAIWLIRRRTQAAARACSACGTVLEPWETSCSHCEMVTLEEAVSSRPVAELAAPDESVLDPEVFVRAPIPEGLDQTIVLDSQPVLIARVPGKRPRSYPLPRDQVFAVGRAPDVNSLEVKDPTVSAQHFKVVANDGSYFVVDLQTTNGTTVNHERVKARKLVPGDVIRVGTLAFTFDLKARSLP